jgi:hypothetical protein
MMSMMTRSQNTPRVRIATIIVAALTLVLAAAHPVQAARLPNCNVSGTTPCFEKVWVDGDQVKMTFVDLNPTPHHPSDVNFYVLAPQTGTPQGGPVPFFHDHVTADTRPHEESHDVNHGDLNVHDENHGDRNLHYHGFFVFCSAQGISSGACVPTMTSIGGGIVPLAKTVNGHRLTSVERIESAANSGLVTLVDTGAVFIARINHDE